MKPFRMHTNSVLVLIGDVLLISASWGSACLLHKGFNFLSDVVPTLPIIVIVKMVVFYFFSLYSGMWRYTSVNDLLNIIKATIGSSLILLPIVLFVQRSGSLTPEVFIIDASLTILLISGFRMSIRLYFEIVVSENESGWNILKRLLFPNGKPKEYTKNLLIIGAGACGEKIYREIRDNAKLQYYVRGFVDDDVSKVGKQIHGIPVLGTTENLKEIVEKSKTDECLIAIPSANSMEMRKIVSRCRMCDVPFKTLPGIGELINGRVSIRSIRDVDYRDLLGREPVRLDSKLIGQYLKNSRVLITGAAGSIGSELCRQICRFKPARLVLVERAESPLYDMEMELQSDFPRIEIIPILGDIRDVPHLSAIFDAYKPQIVFHAAAYKHVPMLERFPWHAVENNIIGTKNVIEMSDKYQVERFVFVSTDKAVRPANVMGTSKRISEMMVQAQNGCGLSKTRFITVRFGNVVGSAGSVIPLFKKQLEKGGPITVTHPEVTRYFMTIPEACRLILQAGIMGEGGEIFILDMGQPVKIADMARDLIRFSGLKPDVDIKIEYIGLRPGEKLYEELITEGEGIFPTCHEKILVLKGPVCHPSMLNGNIDKLSRLAVVQKGDEIRALFKEIVPEYSYVTSPTPESPPVPIESPPFMGKFPKQSGTSISQIAT